MTLGRPAIAVVGVGVLALAGAVVMQATAGTPSTAARAVPVVDRGSLPPTPGPPSAGPPTAGPPTAGPPTAGPPTAAPARHHPVPPGARLRYRRLHVDARIARVSLRGHVMGVPRDPRSVGWWAAGAGPGDVSGTVVLVGHVNYAGTAGALRALPAARPGDRVRIAGPGRELRYLVVAVRTYPKRSGIPADAFARTGPARLVLITCGGSFDPATGNYRDNVVVYAVGE